MVFFRYRLYRRVSTIKIIIKTKAPTTPPIISILCSEKKLTFSANIAGEDGCVFCEVLIGCGGEDIAGTPVIITDAGFCVDVGTLVNLPLVGCVLVLFFPPIPVIILVMSGFPVFASV